MLSVHLLHSGGFRQAIDRGCSADSLLSSPLLSGGDGRPPTMNRQASRRGHRVRHVRLGSLLRLRVRLFGLAGFFVRCLEELNCCPRRRSSSRPQNKMVPSHGGERCHRRPGPAERENSLQAEAIADCLEFIKRSYIPAAAGDHKTDRC